MQTNLSLPTLAAEVARLRDLIERTPMLHRKDLMQRYGICKSTLHNWIRRGLLPRPVRFAGPLWRLCDLEAAERDGRIPPLSV